MGERAVIGVTHPTSPTPIYLYTHWRGERIHRILGEGLAKAQSEGRLEDYSYATRIIFDVLTGLEGGSTGFGICIGEYPSDVQYDIPHVTWHGDGKVTVDYKGSTWPASTYIIACGPIDIDRIMLEA
jgi:hypothetical protein